MKKNTALERMLQGKPAIGAAAAFGSPLAAELLSLAGYDFILVDNQHGVWDDNLSMQAFHNICLGPAIPMARVQQNDFGAIGRLLDRGAMGIVVPLVNSAAEAQAAANAMRYPPRGGRSKGPLGCNFFGVDYMDKANDELFLAVQIESIQAVERAEEILAVDGVDGCWIGPADLAATMGVDISTPKGAEEHQAAVMRVMAACKKLAKIPGIACTEDNAADRIRSGFIYVNVTSDASCLMRNAPATLERLRAVAEE